MGKEYKKHLAMNCRKQWRDLGFYIDLDPIKKCRILHGSYQGLLKFVSILNQYSKDPKYTHHTASAHYGPYANLRIMTHDQCGIDQINIYGTRHDIFRLSQLVEDELSSAIVGDHILIKDQYHPRSSYGLLLVVRENNFDPASLDPEKWMK